MASPRYSQQLPILSIAIASSLLFLRQLEQTKSFWDMEGVTHRSMPGNLLLVGFRPLASKQVYAQAIPRSWRPRINRRIRDSHRAIPDVRAPIDACRNFESRVPHPTVLVVRIVKLYVEINPFALRRNFELLVTLDISQIRAKEY